MKKLEKLELNSKKRIKDEELKVIKGMGGYWDCYCNGVYLGEATSPDICDSRCASCTQCW